MRRRSSPKPASTIGQLGFLTKTLTVWSTRCGESRPLEPDQGWTETDE